MKRLEIFVVELSKSAVELSKLILGLYFYMIVLPVGVPSIFIYLVSLATCK